jgi:hypothetical protein
LTALSSRFVKVRDGADELGRVAADDELGGDRLGAQRDPARQRQRPQPLDRLLDENVHRGRLARRGGLGLDEAQVEQVVDDAPEAVGLAHELLGEPAHHLHVVSRHDRLGEEAERADRRLQLVADVGHEVTPHALDPPGVGDVVDDRHRAGRLVAVAERQRAQDQDLSRWAEQRELTLGDLPLSGPLDELVHGVLRDGLRVPGVAEPQRGHVAELLVAVGVHDDDAVGHAVERGDEAPASVRIGQHRADLRVAARRRRWAQPNRPVM